MNSIRNRKPELSKLNTIPRHTSTRNAQTISNRPVSVRSVPATTFRNAITAFDISPICHRDDEKGYGWRDGAKGISRGEYLNYLGWAVLRLTRSAFLIDSALHPHATAASLNARLTERGSWLRACRTNAAL